MPAHVPYSTDPAISKAYRTKTNLKQQLESCKEKYRDVQIGNGRICVNNPVYVNYYGGKPVLNYTPTWYTSQGKIAPPKELCTDQYAYVTNRECLGLEKDYKEISENLEELERKESNLASVRKNAIASAAAQAKRLAADAAALPGLKRDELACDEYKERTRCRQLRERIAAIEKNQAGSPNSQPTQPNPTNSNSSTNSNNSTNRTQAQPATPTKPFTQPKPTSTTPKPTPARNTGRRPGNGRQPPRKPKGNPIVRPARVSSASSG